MLVVGKGAPRLDAYLSSRGQRKLSAAHVAVARIYADHCTYRSGRDAAPGMRLVATAARVTERHARRLVATLEEVGLLRATGQVVFDSGAHSDRYALTLPTALVAVAPPTEPEQGRTDRSDPGSDNGDSRVGHPRAPGSDIGVPYTYLADQVPADQGGTRARACASRAREDPPPTPAAPATLPPAPTHRPVVGAALAVGQAGADGEAVIRLPARAGVGASAGDVVQAYAAVLADRGAPLTEPQKRALLGPVREALDAGYNERAVMVGFGYWLAEGYCLPRQVPEFVQRAASSGPPPEDATAEQLLADGARRCRDREAHRAKNLSKGEARNLRNDASLDRWSRERQERRGA